ncbi:MAG: hypothetical protein ACSLE0_20105 [Chitinophagaceae bacterium]
MKWLLVLLVLLFSKKSIGQNNIYEIYAIEFAKGSGFVPAKDFAIDPAANDSVPGHDSKIFEKFIKVKEGIVRIR